MQRYCPGVQETVPVLSSRPEATCIIAQHHFATLVEIRSKPRNTICYAVKEKVASVEGRDQVFRKLCWIKRMGRRVEQSRHRSLLKNRCAFSRWLSVVFGGGSSPYQARHQPIPYQAVNPSSTSVLKFDDHQPEAKLRQRRSASRGLQTNIDQSRRLAEDSGSPQLKVASASTKHSHHTQRPTHSRYRYFST